MSVLRELLFTWRTRHYRGHLTLWEWHIWRLYQKYIKPRLVDFPQIRRT